MAIFWKIFGLRIGTCVHRVAHFERRCACLVDCRMTYEFTGWNYEPMIRQGPVKAVFFTVEGEPMVKARPRLTKTGHTYTPKTTVEAEKRVREAFEATGCEGFFWGCRGRVSVFSGDSRSEGC